MTKGTLSALISLVADSNVKHKDVILAELNKELTRGDAVKAARAKIYADNWDAVRGVLETATKGATVSEIFKSLEGKVSLEFTKGKLAYALCNQWADRVVKTEGKVNTYALKA